MKLFRKLYDWMLHWAETPYGPLALFLLALAESSVFPIPVDALLIALCLGSIKKSWRFALYTSVASVVGGVYGSWWIPSFSSMFLDSRKAFSPG